MFSALLENSVSNSNLKYASIAAAISLLSAQAYADPRTGEGPFAGMAGRWSGGGIIRMADGATEQIRCKSTNYVSAAGQAMQQNLRCASQSYRLDISSNVTFQNGAVFGQWNEATRGVSGSIAGRASAGSIVANIVGANFAARLDLRNQGDRQLVTISPQAGADVTAVSIALHKG